MFGKSVDLEAVCGQAVEILLCGGQSCRDTGVLERHREGRARECQYREDQAGVWYREDQTNISAGTEKKKLKCMLV